MFRNHRFREITLLMTFVCGLGFSQEAEDTLDEKRAVKLEYLQDLDVLILRGKQKDVAAAQSLIDDLAANRDSAIIYDKYREAEEAAAAKAAAIRAGDSSEQARQALSRVVQLAFTLRQRVHALRLVEAQQDLQSAQDRLRKRNELRDKIVERRVRQLIADDEFAWTPPEPISASESTKATEPVLSVSGNSRYRGAPDASSNYYYQGTPSEMTVAEAETQLNRARDELQRFTAAVERASTTDNGRTAALQRSLDLARTAFEDAELKLNAVRKKQLTRSKLLELDYRQARKRAELSQAEYDESVAANERVPQAIPAVQLRRQRLEWEEAELEVERAKTLLEASLE